MKTWYGDNCSQCNDLNEPYMVKHHIWRAAVKNKNVFLCIGCLEANIGRKLKITDFLDAPINKGIFGFNAKTYIKYGKDYLTHCKAVIREIR